MNQVAKETNPQNFAYDAVASSPGIAQRIESLSRRKKTVFAHVTTTAQPFLVGLLHAYTSTSAGNFWVVCGSEREQETFYAELLTWLPNAMLFPHLEIAAVDGAIPDAEIAAERLAVLQRLTTGEERAVVVINRHSFDDPVLAPISLRKTSVKLERGMTIDRDGLAEQLVAAGYSSTPQVSQRGEFSVRGGIVDIFSWQQASPVRVEWFDDEIESLREFDIDQQTSLRSVERSYVLVGTTEKEGSHLRDYRKKTDTVIGIDAADPVDVRISSSADGDDDADNESYTDAFYPSPLNSKDELLSSPALRDVAERRVRDQLDRWRKDDYQLLVLYKKESELPHLESIISHRYAKNVKLLLWERASDYSFACPDCRLAVTTSRELLAYTQTGPGRSMRTGRTRGSLSKKSHAIDFTELTEGDLVVHLEYGLARYRGLLTHVVDPARDENGEVTTEEVLALEFAEGAKVYVPLEQAFLVSRYVGIGKKGAQLSRLGDGKWNSTKKAAEKSIYDYAAKLLKIQAVRETQPGITFGPDNAWQHDFEEAFPYKETIDQVRAIHETKADMESGRTMDRLICGDVGFGKTEVAIRAAFKAATGGKQVAMMVPTTVLAQQHYDNFHARMAPFPIVVELLSRYRSAADQTRVAAGLRDGSVDLVIGTHRLISRDVEFKELGLLIVDEEQRFGVKHKERIKERFPNVDVLTLSATPIPRTLYLALTGARDLSTLETPPPNRYPVETVICSYDERIIRSAIDRELDRQGQVYFLHNRVETIEKVRARIAQLCPRAEVDLGHGQMEEGQLENVMQRFVSGETDVLVATTIIESGLDIPNANTIIIDRADRFGLADLYQLRGRVGRGEHKAYAYLMLPRDLVTVGEARKRINAIKQYSSLGAGFKIALRDLEIRGAGNILGLAQSGHLTAVGFDLYCQLLRQAVGKLRGEKVRPRLEVTMRLDFVATSEAEYLGRAVASDDTLATDEAVWPAFLPVGFIEESRLRIQAYRQLASVSRREELDTLQNTWRDRFGRLPVAAENLVGLTRLKLLAASRRVQQVEVREDKLMCTRTGELVLIGGKFPRLTSQEPVSKIHEISDLLENL